jgi:segregation and condensation protein A
VTASLPFLHLPLFDGPLDLLIHLCKRHELELAELPIAQITEQFLAYLEVLEELQIEVAGEFVEMASLLCLLKSREMLPPIDLGDEDDDDGEDPRAVLIERLLEYRRYREAADQLEDRDRPGLEYFVRGLEPRVAAGFDDPDVPLDVDLTDLLGALRDLLVERSRPEPIHAVGRPVIPMEQRVEEILDLLAAGPRRMDFSRLFDGVVTRDLVVVTLLAVLHLAGVRHLRLVQGAHLDVIGVVRRFDPRQRGDLPRVGDVG